MMRTEPSSAQAAPEVEPLIPRGWPAIEGLVCGFGDRQATAPAGTLLLRRQVHGTGIVRPGRDSGRRTGDPGDTFPRVAADADALIASAPGVVVGVRTADCVPMLLVAPHAHWAAVVHAGWRGTIAGIAARAVDAAGEAGIPPDQLLAALGPSIGPCCYEVSDELGEEFARAGLPVLRSHGETPQGSSGVRLRATSGPAGDGPHLDLRSVNALLLERSGVPAANVQFVGPCTRCARDRYHSFRAEPESGGRQISWAGWEDRMHAPDPAPIR